jgi:hypothetical protein
MDSVIWFAIHFAVYSIIGQPIQSLYGAPDSARSLPMRLLAMKVQFSTSQPPVEASNLRLRRPAQEPASEWFDRRMRFRFRTPGIVASCGG